MYVYRLPEQSELGILNILDSFFKSALSHLGGTIILTDK